MTPQPTRVAESRPPGHRPLRPTLLPPLRVLDLTDAKGLLCGKILGDLGADVIKVEPPGGDPARRIGPFYQDDAHPEKSLFWFALNANKRGITLDLNTSDGQALFKRLVSNAEFVLESFPPGYLEARGLAYGVLQQLNPRLIMVSITPFGQNGPYRDFKGPDLIAMGMGGYLNLCGEPDQPPVRISCPQAYLSAGADGAAGAMVAHHHRTNTGEGQHVDVSIQHSVLWMTSHAPEFWDVGKANLRRQGNFRLFGKSARIRVVWPCQDGMVKFGILGGSFGATTMRQLVRWMDEEGMASESLRAIEWEQFDAFQVPQDVLDSCSQQIFDFFLAHTKAELHEQSVRRGIILAPLADAADILNDAQLGAREFWQDVPYPELGMTLRSPGPIALSSETDLRIRRRAPRIGEHNAEIYGDELGLPLEARLLLAQAGVL